MGSQVMPINIPRWDKLRRRQTAYEAYYGTGDFAGKPGMSMQQIADILGVSVGTVHNDIRAMEKTAGKLVARDEAVLERVTQNTLDVITDLDDVNDLILKEVTLAQDTNNRRGTFIPSMLANWAKNKELQAKVLRLLDPKVEITIKAEKAAKMQEAILKALAELAPDVYEAVLDRAEAIYNEGGGDTEAQAQAVVNIIEGGGANGNS